MKKILILALGLLMSCSHYDKSKPSYNATLDGYPYPFDVKKMEFGSQNQMLSMAYMDLPAQGKFKGNALLLHGKNFSGFYFEDIAKELVAKGYRVIIPDQIGFGKSSRPEYYQYSFAQLALNTKTLIDQLGVKDLHVVGHSMGGMLATKFTKFYPELVKRLILVNPIGLEDYLKYVEFQDPFKFYKAELSKSEQKIRHYQQKNYYDGKWSDKYEELIQMHIGQLNNEDWPLVAWNNALTYGSIFAEPIVDDFATIKKPITLIVGTRDRTGPGRAFKKAGVKRQLGLYQKLGKQVAKSFKSGKLIELPGLGHMPQFEDWERFSKVFFPLF